MLVSSIKHHRLLSGKPEKCYRPTSTKSRSFSVIQYCLMSPSHSVKETGSFSSEFISIFYSNRVVAVLARLVVYGGLGSSE